MKKRTTYSAMICRILSMPCLRKSSALGILPHHMIPLFQIGRSIHCCSSFHGSHDSVIPHASSAFRKPFYKGRKKITKIHLRGPLYRLKPQNFLTQPLPHALPEQPPEKMPHGSHRTKRLYVPEQNTAGPSYPPMPPPPTATAGNAKTPYDPSRNTSNKTEPHPAATKKRGRSCDLSLEEAATYSPTCKRSTIGVSELNFSVRNGKRWNLTAITT